MKKAECHILADEAASRAYIEQMWAEAMVIYRICLRYILGFSDEIHIEKNNIRLCDTLEYAKNGTLEAEMRSCLSFKSQLGK
jgi:hypothetical protein